MTMVYSSKRKERGVITIFIAMIMLLLITLLITAAFSLSTTNLRAVGNVKARNEAIAAAQVVIEQIVAEDMSISNFVQARTNSVDIDNDGTFDYTVDVPVPECVRSTQVSITNVSSVSLPGLTSPVAWNTVWEINAIASDPATGVSVSVIQAVRVLLDNIEKMQVCA